MSESKLMKVEFYKISNWFIFYALEKNYFKVQDMTSIMYNKSIVSYLKCLAGNLVGNVMSCY